MVLFTLIALVILMLAVVWFFSFFSDVGEDVFAFIRGFIDESSIKSPNRSGNVVCDMTFELFPAFDEAGFGLGFETQQRLYLGVSSPSSGGVIFHPEVATFNFRPDTCFTQGEGFNLFQLFPTISTDKLRDIQSRTLAITNILGDLSFTIDLKFIRTDDRTVAKTKQLVVVQQQLTSLPQTVNRIFSVDNIEVTNYDVEITCGGDCNRVNQLSQGQPFVYRIRI